ncbi:probable jasmonic acid carboxyl methyltransferase 1 isoform X2 [Quercus robur]|uniref:probable jasmonic acid carboxyl methyltransferase 1 isoform X2 n=1 Tax=Quercus robur TaxID=38942 RepID=UPI00216320DB|nr:probable jasmonic acid carboxyl methyltransferase 1 isoform X2 [Quercus robur]
MDSNAHNSIHENGHGHVLQVEKVFHMTSGVGENSYSHNSALQKTVISKVRPVLEGTVRALYSKENFPRYFSVADLGCSSGPNTLIVTYEMIDAIVGLCRETGHSPPELTVFLNDLPSNDFNTDFKLLPDFYAMLKREKGNDVGPCFIAGMPGSFYGRLFPSKSLDFVHSSYSVHWLSKVPQGINNNKGNIYMGKTSPHNVFEAYLEQFQSDFSLLLRSRADEIKLGGQMILTFIGRSIKDPTSRDCCLVWELLAKCLLDMAAEGLIEEADIDTFNLPQYNPFIEEVKTVVEKEGSFVIDRLETFEVNLDGNDNEENKNYVFDKFTCGQTVSRSYRAISESLLADHFGEAIIDDLFERYAEHIGEHLSMEKIKNFNILISMERK